jgi:hypothetical protein
MTSTTSPEDDLWGPGSVDVVDVVPKKVIRSYLLTLCIYLGLFALQAVTYRQAPSYLHAYLGHNIHNIPKTSLGASA